MWRTNSCRGDGDPPGRENRPDTAPIVAFLNKNPDFNLKLSPLDHYLQTPPDALATLDGRDAVARELRALQRVYKVAPRYAQMRVLRDAGFDSAQAITRLSKTAFVQRLSKPLGGSTQAKVIYEKAAQNAATAWASLAEYGQGFHAAPINVLPSAPPSLPGVPDLETLFGSLDLCACRHCRSVYRTGRLFRRHPRLHEGSPIEDGRPVGQGRAVRAASGFSEPSSSAA